MIRVLLADDDPTTIHHLEKALLTNPEFEGKFDVCSAFSGREALEVYKRNGPESFDCVISDWCMPNGGGEWLIEKIKAIRPDQLIIVHSSETGKLPLPLDVRRVHKPCPMRVLIRAMRAPVQKLLPLLF